MTQIRLNYVHEFLDRHGKPRRYFRRAGFKRIALPGMPGSDEFMTAYQLALAGQATRAEVGSNRTKPGSVNAAVVAYYNSLVFGSFAPGTQKMRRAILERFRVEHGDKRIAMLPHEFIERTLSKRSPAAARNWLKTLRGLLQFAKTDGFRADDPSIGIKLPRLRTKGFHTWTDDEIAQYRAYWARGTVQRLVMEFALETASRRSEVVRLGRQHVRAGRIKIARGKGSAAVDMCITPALQAACDAMPKSDHLTFIVTKQGKPRSPNGLGNDFAKWCDKALLPKHCRMHGLRKGRTRQLVEKKATPHQIMAVTGHRTLAEVQRYSNEYNRPAAADEAINLLKAGEE